MKIRFLKTCNVQDGSGTVFEADHVYDLPDASAQHWLHRKKAELVKPEGAEGPTNPAKGMEDPAETKKSLSKKEAGKQAEAAEQPKPAGEANPSGEKPAERTAEKQEAIEAHGDFPQTREGAKKPDALSSKDIKKK